MCLGVHVDLDFRVSKLDRFKRCMGLDFSHALSFSPSIPLSSFPCSIIRSRVDIDSILSIVISVR